VDQASKCCRNYLKRGILPLCNVSDGYQGSQILLYSDIFCLDLPLVFTCRSFLILYLLMSYSSSQGGRQIPKLVQLNKIFYP
jgi:hypothetical protein